MAIRREERPLQAATGVGRRVGRRVEDPEEGGQSRVEDREEDGSICRADLCG